MRIPFTNCHVPLGRVLGPLALAVPKRAVVPIIQGPARGIRWVVGSGMPNFWLGTYEREKYEAFSKTLHPGMVVYDIGANVGIYTVLACRSVGPTGRVFAFEPATMNLFYMNENIRANRFLNCQVVPKAVGDEDGTVRFEFNESCLGKVSPDGLVQVPSTSLDSFWSLGNPLPQLVKIDVEGAEYDVLKGGLRVLFKAKPTIFLATHGQKVRDCCQMLEELGYSLQYLAADEIVALPR
jgi:FkbM family methyltransferase